MHALPEQVFPKVVYSHHLPLAKTRIQELQKLLHGRRIVWIAVKKELGVDALLPRLDVTQFTPAMKHIKQDVADRSWSDTVEG